MALSIYLFIAYKSLFLASFKACNCSSGDYSDCLLVDGGVELFIKFQLVVLSLNIVWCILCFYPFLKSINLFTLSSFVFNRILSTP